MSSNYALNSNNDIFLQGGRINRVTRGGQVLQNVRCRLLTYLGEWFLNTEVGTPYFQTVFKRPANAPAISATLKARILQTEGVDKLTSFVFNFSRSTRQASVSFTGVTTYGDTISDEVTINV